MKNFMRFIVTFAGILFLSHAIAADKVVVVPLFHSQDDALAPAAPVEKTGQDICYNAAGVIIDCTGTGQDGELQAGVDWPDPRFTDNGDGTVTDKLTGLIWTKTLSCISGDWQSSLDFCNALATGTCGLTGSFVAGDWRLANRYELLSLLDLSQYNPALPVGHPFTVNASSNYISSTTHDLSPASAWIVGIYSGTSGPGQKSGAWKGVCVRSSQ